MATTVLSVRTGLSWFVDFLQSSLIGNVVCMDMVLGLMLMNGLDRPSFAISTDIFSDFLLGSREEQPARFHVYMLMDYA